MKKHLLDSRRAHVITASEAYDVIHNRKNLWERKTKRAPEFSGNDATRWGTAKEKYCIDAFEQQNNCMVHWNEDFFVHPTDPLGCTPDFLHGDSIGECKAPYSKQVYPTIPDRYFYQVQVQLHVMRSQNPKIDHAHFCVWTPTDFKTEIISYDSNFIKWYLPHVLELLEYVKTDTVPKRYYRKPKYTKE
jgi:hypothetical protein